MDAQVAKVRCPRCQSRLDVMETPSGARIVAVTLLGSSVEEKAAGLEVFMTADDGPQIKCPACLSRFDPSSPGTIPPLRRR
jgi:DNA-directed RNA polymerase subunit RPC12/RpoP